VTSRVGISWLSTAKACSNLNDEIPENTQFSQVVNGTISTWNTEVLSKVTTTTTNSTNLELLYTSLYFMHLIPTNQTGENPLWSSAEPYYQDIFTLWVCSNIGEEIRSYFMG
jgi:putative alpha-1,2-mannosidase